MDVNIPMYLNGDGQNFEVSKFEVVSLDSEYLYNSSSATRPDFFLRSSDVSDQGIVSTDLPNRKIRFGFTGQFVVEPEVILDDDLEDGRVVGWRYAFKATAKATVYKYPNLEIAYWEEPLGTTPSPGTPTPTPTPTSTPDVEKIVAQFEIDEPVIEFGEYNWAKPVGSSVSGGGYSLKEYVWTISQNGNTETQSSNSVLTMGGFPPYPRWMTTGTVSVSLKVISTSGNYKTAGPKTFEVIRPPSCSSYNPNLDFKAGFVNHGNRGAWEAVTTAVVGDYLDVQVLAPRPDDEPPPSGSYPRSYISWDWKNAIKSSTWLKKYYDNYQPNEITEEYYSFPYNMVLTNDNLGNHSIKATRTDACGNSNSSTATVTVVPPNPVAVIRGPATVKEARPLSEPFDANSSYSPVTGRTINHSRDEWGNKQSVYYTPGNETITLKVLDNAGLPSLNTAVHTLTVLPDEPPIALLKTQSKAIRGVDVKLKDASYSPDGDTIKLVELFVKYDSNNNGSFDDEPETQLVYDSSGNLTRTYDKVGKYWYRTRAVEESPLNKEATSYFEVEVVNDSPWVSFEMASEVKEPQIIPTVSVSLNPDNWSATSTFDEQVKKNWKTNDDGSLGTYPYYTQTKADGYLIDPSSSSYRTADPNASETIKRTAYSQWYGDGDSDTYNLYFTGTKGYVIQYDNYCRDCGNQYSHNASIYNMSGTLLKQWYSGQLYDINVFADEIVMGNWGGYGQAWYGVYKLSSLFTNPATAAPLRTYPSNSPPPRSGNLNNNLVAKYTSSGLGNGSELPPNSTPGSQFKINETENPSVMKIQDAGPSRDGTLISYAGFGAAKKTAKSGSEIWKKNFDWREGYSDRKFEARNFTYNLDESKVYVFGLNYTYQQDVEYEWYWSATGYAIKVLNTSDGSEINTIPFPAEVNVYQTLISTYMGKLVFITPNGLYVYDDNLNLLKYDNRITNGKITGDGFIISSTVNLVLDNQGISNWYTVYDLRTYEFYSTGNNVERFPREMYYDNLANEGIMKQAIGSTVNSFSDEDQKTYTTQLAAVKNVPFANRPLASHSQLINSELPSMKDFNINFKYRYADLNYTGYNMSGMSFKIQDRRNMYRLEFNNTKLNLVKIVDGNRTVLHTQDYAFDKGAYYSFRIRSNANKHTVYVNGVPLFDVTDGTFQAGSFGPSTDFFNVFFKEVTYQDLSAASGSSLTKDTVIVDQAIQYSVMFEDTENDAHPIDLTWWRFEQTNPWKFLDAGDGKTGWSLMNGAEHHGSLPSLDRVGIWRVTHWLKDDPHPWFPFPSETFGGYRAESNRYSRNIIVHRRPVALFTLWLNGDGTVGWNEQSYDPDRWLSAWNYSTESPVYAMNKGIYARKYKYSTPGGLELEGKLTRPTESGVYTVSEAVMDEYGAWSDWYDQQITATIILPPNRVPVVDFESPRYVYRDDLVQLTNKSVEPDGDPMSYNWSIMKPPYTSWLSNAQHPSFRIIYRGLGKDAVSPNWFITLEATDSKGETGSKTKPLTVLNHMPTTAINGPGEVLIHQTDSYRTGGADQDSEDNGNLSYYWRVTAPDGTETDYAGNTILTLTFNQGGTYKLEHWVIDPVGDSSNVAQLLVDVDDNKPPVPGFTVTPNPAYRGEPVSIVSKASDPDGIVVRYDYWITRPDGTEQHWTTAPDWSRTYSTVGSYTIRQRVEDNKGAAAEFSQVLQVINRLPTVELSTPSGPDADHPSVNIPPFRAEWSYADGDSDPQQSWHFRIYESGTNKLMIEGSGIGAANGYDVVAGILEGGVTYYAVVTVSDGYDTATSTPKYFTLNRPPAADFDWSPKPIWEGDTVRLFSLSYDPDGDDLTYRWLIRGPSGQEWSGSSADWSGLWIEPGMYTVKLIVSDGLEEATAEKLVEVLPLTIEADLSHTPEWLAHHMERGHETSQAPKDFYAGEKLLLHLISAPAPVATAEAWLEAIGIGGGSIRVESQMTAGDMAFLFAGELYDPVLGSLDNRLPDGLHEVHFRLTYMNGVVKETAVPFRIIGSALGTVGVHRVQ